MQILCPLCRTTLLQQARCWCCTNGHSFDTAKQGYTNLLPVQNKKSKSPGDDKPMVAARSRFLDDGHYLPIANAVNNLIYEKLQQKKTTTATVIDAGCGEGYYSSQLKNNLLQQQQTVHVTGFDISKHAVLAAAKRDKNIDWFVANSSSLPVNDHDCDVLISLFSPIPEQEFHRCLKPGGLLVVAATGKQHLIELRQLIYDTVKEEAFNPDDAIDEQRFAKGALQTIQFSLELNSTQAILDLLAMTPHYWRASPQRKAELTTLKRLSVSVDISLHCYQAT